MIVLGISAFYHDAAACLLEKGLIVAAAQEERFTRKRHDSRFPRSAIAYCLAEGRISASEIDAVVFYDKPFLKFERLLETYLAFAPRGFSSFRTAMPSWLRERLFLKSLLGRELSELGAKLEDRLLFSEHHFSHAASAFFASPYDDAAVLTMDGVGEWATGSAAIGHGNRLDIQQEMHFPHSLGLLYSAFTHYLGFKVNSGEYKVMGLAPYGEPRFASRILDRLIDVKPDGSFWLAMEYFDFCTGLAMTNQRFAALFDSPARSQTEPLAQHHMDVAASIQAVTDEIMLRLTRSLARTHTTRNLCLAGGVALNCVSNGRILRDGHYESIWIQPAAGDAGGAVGAALAGYHAHFGQPREPRSDAMKGALLGPSFTQAEIEARLVAAGAIFDVLELDSLVEAATTSLERGQAVGWFQGRMEFGPRALGNRSILADPRSPTMQATLNVKIKHRESFRPFAPSVKREAARDWFDLRVESPYMLLVADVIRREIPAVTHVDGSARVQTVDAATNPLYHRLLSAFEARTQCPVLVNTSFNVRGEPLVCTPEDAYRCFMGTEIDTLAIGRCLLTKERQPVHLRRDYSHTLEPD